MKELNFTDLKKVSGGIEIDGNIGFSIIDNQMKLPQFITFATTLDVGAIDELNQIYNAFSAAGIDPNNVYVHFVYGFEGTLKS